MLNIFIRVEFIATLFSMITQSQNLFSFFPNPLMKVFTPWVMFFLAYTFSLIHWFMMQLIMESKFRHLFTYAISTGMIFCFHWKICGQQRHRNVIGITCLSNFLVSLIGIAVSQFQVFILAPYLLLYLELAVNISHSCLLS